MEKLSIVWYSESTYTNLFFLKMYRRPVGPRVGKSVEREVSRWNLEQQYPREM